MTDHRRVDGGVAARGKRRGLGTVLALLLVGYTAVVGLGGGPLGGPVRVIVLGAILLVTTRMRAEDSLRRRWPGGVALACVAASVIAAVAGSPRVATVTTAAAVLILALTAVVSIGRFVVRRPVADGQSIAGALAVYLLLVLVFSAVHQGFAAALGGDYLSGITGYGDSAGILYFSVITATTVGFGDITPVSAVARAVTMSEALAGQLYLVAIVGAVVGNWGSPTRSRARLRAEAGADPRDDGQS